MQKNTISPQTKMYLVALFFVGLIGVITYVFSACQTDYWDALEQRQELHNNMVLYPTLKNVEMQHERIMKIDCELTNDKHNIR